MRELMFSCFVFIQKWWDQKNKTFRNFELKLKSIETTFSLQAYLTKLSVPNAFRYFGTTGGTFFIPIPNFRYRPDTDTDTDTECNVPNNFFGTFFLL